MQSLLVRPSDVQLDSIGTRSTDSLQLSFLLLDGYMMHGRAAGLGLRRLSAAIAGISLSRESQSRWNNGEAVAGLGPLQRHELQLLPTPQLSQEMADRIGGFWLLVCLFSDLVILSVSSVRSGCSAFALSHCCECAVVIVCSDVVLHTLSAAGARADGGMGRALLARYSSLMQGKMQLDGINSLARDARSGKAPGSFCWAALACFCIPIGPSCRCNVLGPVKTRWEESRGA